MPKTPYYNIDCIQNFREVKKDLDEYLTLVRYYIVEVPDAEKAEDNLAAAQIKIGNLLQAIQYCELNAKGV